MRAVRRVQFTLLVVTAAMTANVVGSIGSGGLIILHAARFLVGPLHGRLLPAAALGGSIFMVGAITVSRLIILQKILLIGVVTALFGAPALAIILYRVRRSA